MNNRFSVFFLRILTEVKGFLKRFSEFCKNDCFFFFFLGTLENVPCLCKSDIFPQVDLKSSTVSTVSTGVQLYLILRNSLHFILSLN